MAKLIMWNLMTLDGYVAGPNGDISFHEDVWGPELEQFSIEQGMSAGGLMFGRVTYDLMAGYWPEKKGTIPDFMNALPKFVFSRSLKSSTWNNTQVFNDNVADNVARLKRETPKDIYIFGSADLSGSLIPHGLIDEFRIGIAPRIIGGGTPLFRQGKRQKLKLLDARPISTGAVILRYEPAK